MGSADWRRHAEPVVAGARSRRAALVGALLAGVIVALATYPAQRAWLNNRHTRQGDDRGAPAPAPPSSRQKY